MLAQRRLFRRRTDAATIGALLQDPIPAPSAVRPGLPKALDAIVLRALSRDPDGRYETARAFGAALLEHTGQPPVGLGDLARWMALLFPGERQNKEALVSRARAFVPAVPHKRGKRGLSRGLRRGLVVITIAGAAGVAGAVGLAAGMRTAARPPDQRAAPRVEAEASAMPSIAAEPRVDAVQITRTEMPAPSTRSPAHAAAARSERGRRAPRHAIAGGTGQVNISTPGCWALVFVDGRARGQTPTQITLGAGHQSIELRPFGRARGRRFAVDIEPGELARLRVPVARLR